MDPRAEELTLKRLRIFARACFLWALVILGRLIQLQIVEHDEYRRLALIQQERNIEIRAPRGTILDRNGQPLAMSVPVDSVCVNPLRIPDVGVAADILSRVLSLNESELLTQMTTAVDNKRGFMWIKRKITEQEAAKLRSYKFDWIEFRAESARFYPKGALAAHVLGGVDFEERGNGGIEQVLDKKLRGVPGIIRTTADVRQKVFDLKVFSDPQPGAKVTLTIDERVQYAAERELGRAVIGSGASSGSLVAMDPRTGDVLALANYPTYDPNKTPKDKDDFLSRSNLAVTAPFEPGSVFKVITLATALETTKLTPDSLFFCHNGAFTLFRRVIHDAKPHGTLSMADVLAKSSNIGAIKAALAVGNEDMYRYVRKFGFGQTTGLPVAGESAGILRKLSRWIPSSIGSIAMGHEISTTTIQLARACSVIANGGFLVKPRLVLADDRDGKAAPGELTPVLKPDNAMKMRIMMRGVVDLPHGTGKRARLKGYSAAGKTGSAQIYDYANKVYLHRYNGSFMGFAPVNNPAVVIVVTLNGTRSGSQGFGGVVAAPVFQAVATAALRLLDVPKDLPDDVDPVDDGKLPESDLAVAGLSQPPFLEDDAVAAPSGAQPAPPGPAPAAQAVANGPKAPDFHGKTKRQVLSESLASGVRVQMAGSGIVRSQMPPPGVMLRPGEHVKVVFAR